VKYLYVYLDITGTLLSVNTIETNDTTPVNLALPTRPSRTSSASYNQVHSDSIPRITNNTQDIATESGREYRQQPVTPQFNNSDSREKINFQPNYGWYSLISSHIYCLLYLVIRITVMTNQCSFYVNITLFNII